MASEQPNVDEHGNVVVTSRQALGKEKKKRDGDDSDDDDGRDLRVLKCRGAFTPSTRLVSIRRGLSSKFGPIRTAFDGRRPAQAWRPWVELSTSSGVR